MHETSEYIGKARVLAELRAMDPNWLDEHGYSLAALNRGVEAWPWRKPERSQAAADNAAVVTPLQRKSTSTTPVAPADRDHDDAA